MGLDMYLEADLSIYDETVKENVGDVVNVSNYKLNAVLFEIMYWRKANAIHKWFVDNCGDGDDKCQRMEVSVSMLKDLLKLCKEVVDSPHLAPTILPTTDGFLFGSIEYGHWYFKNLEDTINCLESLFKNSQFCTDAFFYYRSSW